MLDVLLVGGTVVDGTGAPGRVADVGVRDGRVVTVCEPGAAEEPASRAIDVTGLVVAPGFVDLHTHYDAQLLWDPSASPSPLHGVTTAFAGNCGFALAPMSDAHLDYMSRLMARVEGIPLPALQEGVAWDWHSFGDYLARLESGGVALNVGVLAGHSTLRRFVMGEASVTDAADEATIEALERALHEALDAGALGFSTSQAPTHNDGNGNPVPSRAASTEELLRLAACVRDHPGTQLECIIAGCINGFTDDDVEFLAEMSIRADRPLNWNVLGVMAGGNHEHQLTASTRAAQRGGRVVALTLPQGMRIRLSFLSGFVLDGLPGWRETLSLPVSERMRALADPAVRANLDAQAHSPEAGVLAALANWERMECCETFTDATREFEGRIVGDIAREQGKAPFDALLDIVVADGLRTGLRPVFGAESDETWKQRAEVWRDPRAVVGGSDAGAHLDMMCGATYSSYLVGPAVREHGVVSLEEAVRMLTDVPARLYGLRGRGRVQPGWRADLVVFDPESVGPLPDHTVADLPGGASRIVAGAAGIEHVIVNGVEIVETGTYTGSTPGTVLRAGRDTDTVHAG